MNGQSPIHAIAWRNACTVTNTARRLDYAIMDAYRRINVLHCEPWPGDMPKQAMLDLLMAQRPNTTGLWDRAFQASLPAAEEMAVKHLECAAQLAADDAALGRKYVQQAAE